jgi:hypothetical protein
LAALWLFAFVNATSPRLVSTSTAAMKIQSSVKIALAATYVLLVSCLDHEKSFLASDGVSTVQSMAVHNNSLFISTSNDVVQKDIGT